MSGSAGCGLDRSAAPSLRFASRGARLLRGRRLLAPRPEPARVWSDDTACSSEPGAAAFAEWFDTGARSIEWRGFVEAVPLSRVYEIADQARAYADAWRSFAESLERRSGWEGSANQ